MAKCFGLGFRVAPSGLTHSCEPLSALHPVPLSSCHDLLQVTASQLLHGHSGRGAEIE